MSLSDRVSLLSCETCFKFHMKNYLMFPGQTDNNNLSSSTPRIQAPRVEPHLKIPLRATVLSGLTTSPYWLVLSAALKSDLDFGAKGIVVRSWMTFLNATRCPITALATYSANKKTRLRD